VKPKFSKSEPCLSGAHCDTCRNSRAWRESVSLSFDVGPKGADFRCPYPIRRRLWRWRIGTKIARATTRVGIPPCGDCKGRQALLDGTPPNKERYAN